MSVRVLVTGASGFVGRAVVPRLIDASYEVHAVSRDATRPAVDGVVLHRADLLDRAETEALVDAVRPSHLLHLAWYTTPGRFWSSEQNLAWVGASLDLARAFAAVGGRRAVVTGSCAEYDLTDGRCSETRTPLRPASLYGACKHAVQEVLAAHSASAGYSHAWARIFHPYGPAEQPERLVPSVIRSALTGRPVDLSEGHQERDFVFVDDVAEGLVRLLGSDLEGAVNIGSGRSTSVRSLVAMIADAVATPAELRFGARAAAEAEPALIVADTARSRDDLGWTPAVPLAEGIDRTVSWWRSRLGDVRGSPARASAR